MSASHLHALRSKGERTRRIHESFQRKMQGQVEGGRDLGQGRAGQGRVLGVGPVIYLLGSGGCVCLSRYLGSLLSLQ